MEIKTTSHTLKSLDWRYATKKFNASKKLSDNQLELLLTAVQLAPSSYGLQPYKILVITNPEIKQQLKAAAYGQTQLTDASHIFVFARIKNFTTEHVDDFVANIVSTRGIESDTIQGYIDVMKGTVNSRTEEELANWNARQAYIALGFLLETAAQNEIDTCPMEGFDAAKFDAILSLEDKNLTSVVIATVGFRAEEDSYQHYQKVRKSKEELYIHI